MFSKLQPYLELSKIRLSLTNAVMPVAGYYTSADSLDMITTAGLFVGGGLMAMSSQAMGQIIDVSRDAIMRRTKNRPLVIGQLTNKQAKLFALGTFVIANVILAPIVSAQSVLTLNAINLGYFIYVKSKPKTPASLFIGAIVGSLPVLAGGLAGANFLELKTKLLYDTAFMFLWQFPHFLRIHFYNREDYRKAGFKMFGAKSCFILNASSLLLQMLLVSRLEDQDVFHQGVKAGLLALLGWHLLTSSICLAGIKLPQGSIKKILSTKYLPYIELLVYYFIYNLYKPETGKKLF